MGKALAKAALKVKSNIRQIRQKARTVVTVWEAFLPPTPYSYFFHSYVPSEDFKSSSAVC